MRKIRQYDCFNTLLFGCCLLGGSVFARQQKFDLSAAFLHGFGDGKTGIKVSSRAAACNEQTLKFHFYIFLSKFDNTEWFKKSISGKTTLFCSRYKILQSL